MLTGKQKSELRGIAQTRKPLFQMGKDAISENLIKTISDSLEAHELVKVSLLKTCAITANEAAVTISAATQRGGAGDRAYLYAVSAKQEK